MDALVIDIVDLPRQTGSFKDVHLDLPAPEGLGTDVIGVAPGSPLTADVALTSTEDGVLVRATAGVSLHGECVRCLEGIDEDRTVTFDELYLLPEVARAQEAEEGGGEEVDASGLDTLFVLGETTLDLEPALRDAVVSALPYRPLCSPDCQGLCQECGERLDDLPADHHHESLDPRWAALGALLDGAGDQA